MEKILESTEEFDTELFDRVVEKFYSPGDPEQKRAEKTLLAFRDHPDSWARASAVLKRCQDIKAKLFVLQVLEKMVRIRWPLLTEKQQQEVREYVVEGVLAPSGTKEPLIVKGLIQTLKEIMKREWPDKWPTLLPDLLQASSNDPDACRNVFCLVDILCDEIYNFPRSITSKRAAALRKQMQKEMGQLYMRVMYMLEQVSMGVVPAPDSIVDSALSLIHRITAHLPKEYVFSTEFIAVVCRYIESRFTARSIEILQAVAGRKEKDKEYFDTLRTIFLEVGAFAEKYFGHFEKIYGVKLKTCFPQLMDKDAELIKKLVILFSAVYENVKSLEGMGCNTVGPLEPLLEISEISDFEMFRLCTEFWSTFVKDLFLEFPFAPPPQKQPAGLRRGRYNEILSRLLKVYVVQMARPQEVIITENDNGEVVLERLSETESIAHYNEMKETLFNIAAVFNGGVTGFFLSEIKVLEGSSWTRESISKLCWALPAVSAAMSPTAEKEFMFKVIRSLLEMCEKKKNESDRAVMAACVMYVLSQTPRFLRSVHMLLVITFHKLFDFMQEPHVGAREMACETFLSLASTCGQELSVIQPGSKCPEVDNILPNLTSKVSLLSPHQIDVVYEGMCHIAEHRAGQLISYCLEEITAESMETYASIQNVMHSVRRLKIICKEKSTESFCHAREKTMQDTLSILMNLYERAMQLSKLSSPQIVRNAVSLWREIVSLYVKIAENFSIQFILGEFMGVCSRVVLSPLNSNTEFSPEGLDLLEALCRRTVEGPKPLVDAVIEEVAGMVLNDPLGKEELMKSFFRMLCTAVATQPGMNTMRVLEWLTFGASQKHREISEGCAEAIVNILGKLDAQTVHLVFFGLLECIVGEALDTDHEGGMSAYVQAISILIQYSIEEKCPLQSEVLSTFGLRLHQLFPHLQPVDIEEFINGCYANVHSHSGLVVCINDFRIRINTV